jgi:hypothetical protein
MKKMKDAYNKMIKKSQLDTITLLNSVYDDFVAITSFIEKTINMNLGYNSIEEYRIHIKEPALEYVKAARVHYMNIES